MSYTTLKFINVVFYQRYVTITYFTHVHKYRTHRTFITNIPVTTVFVLMFIVYFLDKDNSETEAECVSVLIFLEPE